MKNKVLSKGIVLAIILVLSLALSGCDLNKKIGQNEENVDNAEEAKQKNFLAFEYIEKIKPENTVEEINKIIGSNGELTDEKYNKYTWKITDDVEITATYYSSKTATIKIDIDKKFLKDNRADLSCAKDIKSQVNSKDGIKYDDFVSKIGTKGYLIEKSSSSVGYIWVNEDGGYIKGTFSVSSGKCTFFSAWA